MDKGYATLLESYKRMFKMVDAFHFNSQNTADVYTHSLEIPEASRVINISHSGIKDNRQLRTFDSALLRLGFVGSEEPYKGLPMLKEVIYRLNEEGSMDKIEMSVYGGRYGVDKELPNVFYKGHFSASMQEDVYNGMDLLVVPSICYETFSFVTIEALSFGTCVLVSDKVGAKDIVAEYNPRFVFQSKDELFNVVKCLIADREELIHYNKNIVTYPWSWSMEKHAKDIVEQLYQPLIK